MLTSPLELGPRNKPRLFKINLENKFVLTVSPCFRSASLFTTVGVPRFCVCGRTLVDGVIFQYAVQYSTHCSTEGGNWSSTITMSATLLEF